jgi:sulfonate transport system substrate-binding protein
MRRRDILKLGAGLGLAGVLPPLSAALASPLGGTAEKSDIDLKGVTLRFGMPSPLNNVRLNASKQLDGLDFKVELANFAGSVPALEALNAGAIDLMSGGVGNLLAIAANPGKSVIVGVITNFFYAGILLPASSTVKSVAELKGKRLAVLKGSGTDYRAAQALEAAGLKWTDVNSVNLGPAEGLGALIGGSIDAWAMWDPQAAIAELQNGAKVLAELSVPSYNYLCASTASLANPAKEAAIVRLMQRDLNSYKWVRDNPGQWTSESGKVLKLDEKIAKIVGERTPKDGGLFVPVDDAVLKDAARISQFYYDVGINQKVLETKIAFDARYNGWLSAKAPKL